MQLVIPKEKRARNGRLQSAPAILTCEPHFPDHRGQICVVDPARLDELSQFDWRVRVSPQTNYVGRYVADDFTGKWITIQSVVYGPVLDGYTLDHENRNGMDNRLCNLRPANAQQQCWNQAPTPGSASRFKGVTFQRGKAWTAGATHPITGEHIHLGSFPLTDDGEMAAARAYDRFAKAYQCGFGYLNFPLE